MTYSAFAPTKSSRSRKVVLNAQTVALLRAHKKAQAAIKSTVT